MLAGFNEQEILEDVHAMSVTFSSIVIMKCPPFELPPMMLCAVSMFEMAAWIFFSIAVQTLQLGSPSCSVVMSGLLKTWDSREPDPRSDPWQPRCV